MIEIPGIQEPFSTRIRTLFTQLPSGTGVILFGSRAKGNFREGSDIDIALKGGGVTEEHRKQLIDAYDKLFLPWKLDLILYDSIQESDLRAHIDRVGKRI